MEKFRFETHAHTSEVSPCGSVCAADLVSMYQDAGYSGVCITDHFSQFSMEGKERWPIEKKVEFYREGFLAAKAAAKPGFTVLQGMELRFYENANDYLVYGDVEAFLLRHPTLLEMGFYPFVEAAKSAGLCVFQAHPFRNWMQVMDPQKLDGIEAHNGNPRHDSRNDIATAWAEKYHLYTSSGSDFHEVEDIARGGILTDQPIRTSNDLIAALKGGCELIRPE